jgi:hypothetical protein
VYWDACLINVTINELKFIVGVCETDNELPSHYWPDKLAFNAILHSI